MVVALEGNLGVGKTTLIKGIARALGIKDEVTSPGFTIISEYLNPRGLRLLHIDLYRIEQIRELEDLGFEEILNNQEPEKLAISVIEWSDRAGEFIPEESINIHIHLEKNGYRSIQITGLNL